MHTLIIVKPTIFYQKYVLIKHKCQQLVHIWFYVTVFLHFHNLFCKNFSFYNTKTRIIGNLLERHDLLCKHNDFRQHFLMFIFLWYLHFQVAFLDMQRRLHYVNLCQHLLGSRCDYESIRYWRMKFVFTRNK